jgi:hypothetical protein
MRSLASDARPFLADDPKEAVDRKKMEMTRTSWRTARLHWVRRLARGVPQAELAMR